MAYGKNNSRPGHTGGSKGVGPQGGGRKAKGAPPKTRSMAPRSLALPGAKARGKVSILSYLSVNAGHRAARTVRGRRLRMSAASTGPTNGRGRIAHDVRVLRRWIISIFMTRTVCVCRS